MKNRLIGNCTQESLRELLAIYEEKSKEIKRTTFLKHVTLDQVNRACSKLYGNPNYTREFFLRDYALRTYSFKHKKILYYVLVWSANDIIWELSKK